MTQKYVKKVTTEKGLVSHVKDCTKPWLKKDTNAFNVSATLELLDDHFHH